MKLNTILSRLPVATVICGGLLLPVFTSGKASDPAREQHLAEQIVDAVFDGEPVYLEGSRTGSR